MSILLFTLTDAVYRSVKAKLMPSAVMILRYHNIRLSRVGKSVKGVCIREVSVFTIITSLATNIVLLSSRQYL